MSDYAAFSARTPGPDATLESASPHVVVVLDLADGWRIEQDGDGGRFDSFVGGLHDGPTLVEHPGRSHGLQIGLTPLGARALLGVPGVELAHRVVDLEDVLGPAGKDLVERLAGARDDAARFALLDSVLLPRAAAAAPPRPDVARALDRLVATNGSLRIAALAAELGCSRRHLSTSFHRELGLPPKAYARILRLCRATDLLERGVELARVAAVTGYADQPHLSGEFRALAGRTPVTFLQDRALAAA